MSEWKKVKLGEITESCLGKMLDAAKNRGEYKPYLANLNVRWGSFDTDNLSLMRFEEDEDERYGIKYGDLIICEGGEPGRCAIWKEQLPDMKIQKALHRVRPKDGLVDNFYLFYWFLLAGKCNWIDQYCTGATIKHLPGQKLKEVIVDLPPIEVQHRIAIILSRYDTLIENYQKQIKLLEEAAQRLYKEWFVELRFPGHENTKMVDGLPEGWEKKKAIDFFEMSIGKTPPRAEKQWFTDGKVGVPWVSISDMKDVTYLLQTSEGLTKEACEKHNVRIIDEGTVLLSFKLTVGRVSIAGMNVCTNEAIAHFDKNGDDWREYTLLYLRNYNYDTLGNTSGISKAVNSTIVKNMPFLMPSGNVLDAFSNVAKPLFQKIKNLSFQIRLLTEARDRLLPRLMGGKVEVDAPKGQRAINPVHRSGYNPQTNHAPKGQKN